MTGDPLDLDLDPWVEAFDTAFRHVPLGLYDEEQKPAERALGELLEERARLVEVARAARDLLADDDMPNHWDDCVCSYCIRNRALRAALVRLDGPR